VSDMLSQQEVDSLLSGISTGQVDAAPEVVQRPDPIAFDFRLPHRLSKVQLRAFRSVHENFGDGFAAYLASRLQTAVTVRVSSVDQLFYSEHVHAIGNPGCLYVFRVKEPNTLAALEFHPSLILSIVEHLMGGNDGEAKPARLITRIEQNVVRGVIQRSIVDLQRAWKTAADFTFIFDRYESEPELMHMAPPSEIVLVVSFEVTISGAKHTLSACFPVSAIEEVLARLNAQSHAGVRRSPSDGNWSKPLLKMLEGTGTRVVAKIGETSLTVRELLTLEPGDILRTRLPIEGEVALIIGGVPRFYGRPGVSHGNIAVKVSRPHSEQLAGE
jgi:flagellar motor switch protein FliM